MFLLIQSALWIFVLRVVDVALATLRMLLIIRGRKALAWIVGFVGAFVFVIAIREVLTNLDNWLNVIGYAAGFATGNVAGMWLEERLAIGYTHLRVISPQYGQAIAERLREAGFAVTEISGRGRDGAVTLLNCSVLRKDGDQVQRLINDVDPNAFITAEDVRRVRHGYWRS